mgnify:CR=1 FL=1
MNAHDEGGEIQVSWTHEGNDEGIWTGDMYYRVQYIVDGTTYTQDFADRNLTSVLVTQGIPTCLPIEYTVQIRTDAKIISSCKSNLETMAPTREAVIDFADRYQRRVQQPCTPAVDRPQGQERLLLFYYYACPAWRQRGYHTRATDADEPRADHFHLRG